MSPEQIQHIATAVGAGAVALHLVAEAADRRTASSAPAAVLVVLALWSGTLATYATHVAATWGGV
ncbi:hypothetical protein L0U85_03760 [Glycomyces sp. L485]|uniref:hypothetical protein n=1 Tax=Glycomyces sp. L485 TaxID=2909235 RepID=UPI001F4B9577|nr:hypothetical protein [Glycomyces sp. L485]MCH7229978.1 hypothetical protein [Glycomyces sp. L485]